MLMVMIQLREKSDIEKERGDDQKVKVPNKVAGVEFRADKEGSAYVRRWAAPSIVTEGRKMMDANAKKLVISLLEFKI